MELSRDEKDQLESDGWVRIDDVVPVALTEAVVAATSEFLGVAPDDPETWAARESHGHGIVALHHHPALWAVRQHPDLYELFVSAIGADALWVTLDRVSFKTPSREDYRVSRFHWDADPTNSDENGFQGLVYLRDTADDQGAFCCIPGIYRGLDEWLERDDWRSIDPDEHDVVNVGGKRGSVVIWSRRLPHSSARNVRALPRWVQYVAYSNAGSEANRENLARRVEDRRPPEWAIRQSVPGQLDPEPKRPLDLTPLGRLVAGLDTWD